MNRDDARAIFASSGLTYANLTAEALGHLANRVNMAIKADPGCDQSIETLDKITVKTAKDGEIVFAEIVCASSYFENRPAISFNRDGFIGFAGWADDANVAPLLQAFIGWTDEIAPEEAALTQEAPGL